MARFGTMQVSHQQTNWTWQIQLWQQQFQEWWEWTLQQLGKQLPNLDGIDVPPLYLQILLWLLLGVVGIQPGLRLMRTLQDYRRRRWHGPTRSLLSLSNGRFYSRKHLGYRPWGASNVETSRVLVAACVKHSVLSHT